MAIRKPIKTELQLSKLRPETSRYDVPVAVAPGMAVRVFPSGSITFRWDRGKGSVPRYLKYGNYPEMGLTAACKAHEAAKNRHAHGEILESSNMSVSDLLEVFYQRRLVPQRKNPEEGRKIIERHIIPVIGERKLSGLTTMACRSVVERVVDRGATTHAGKVLALLKQMLDFAVSRGDMEINPAISLKAENLGVVTKVRQRALSADEIRTFLLALERHPRLSIQTKLTFQILLLTGVRTGELLKARWDNVNLDNATWIIPPEDQKLTKRQEAHARPFIVPLSHQAVGLLQHAKSAAGDSPFVMGTSSKLGRLEDKVLGHALRRMFEREMLTIPPFTPHDLRRTCRTHLGQSLKVPPHIAERCLNHSLGRIVETYDTGDYLEERSEAMQQWANLVDSIYNKHAT